MEKQILSVQATSFKNKETGEDKPMWKVYCADDSGAVGAIYSTREYRPGDFVTLGLAVNRDGKFVAKIIG